VNGLASVFAANANQKANGAAALPWLFDAAI